MSKLADQLPPPALKPFSLVRRYSDGRVVTIPVLLQLLTKEQLRVACADAAARIARTPDEQLEGRDRDDVLEEAKQVEILSYAVRRSDDTDHPEMPGPWLTSMEFDAVLSTVDVAALVIAFDDFQAEQASHSDDVSHDLYETTLDALADDDLSIWDHMTATAREKFATLAAKELLGRRIAERANAVATEAHAHEVELP